MGTVFVSPGAIDSLQCHVVCCVLVDPIQYFFGFVSSPTTRFIHSSLPYFSSLPLPPSLLPSFLLPILLFLTSFSLSSRFPPTFIYHYPPPLASFPLPTFYPSPLPLASLSLPPFYPSPPHLASIPLLFIHLLLLSPPSHSLPFIHLFLSPPSHSLPSLSSRLPPTRI